MAKEIMKLYWPLADQGKIELKESKSFNGDYYLMVDDNINETVMQLRMDALEDFSTQLQEFIVLAKQRQRLKDVNI